MGTLPPRYRIGSLQHVQQAKWSEVMQLIETEQVLSGLCWRRPYAAGLNPDDLGAQIRTLDNRLATLGRRLRVGHTRDAH